MTYGFKVVQEMISGLSEWMDEKEITSTSEIVGRAVPNTSDWQHLNLNYIAKAKIDQDLCISCGRCFAACEDTSHQAILMSEDRIFTVDDEECVACNLCVNVCPVENCISMEAMAAGSIDPRTGVVVSDKKADWTTHPNNPMATAAE
jgi:dihydropyrimidine dehydrogenase (NAD+) subunit PreA